MGESADASAISGALVARQMSQLRRKLNGLQTEREEPPAFDLAGFELALRAVTAVPVLLLQPLDVGIGHLVETADAVLSHVGPVCAQRFEDHG